MFNLDVYTICNAYESGVGHGEQNDGHSKGPYKDVRLNEAYMLGYNTGLELYNANRKKEKEK
jgi:hypothetical protein